MGGGGVGLAVREELRNSDAREDKMSLLMHMAWLISLERNPGLDSVTVLLINVGSFITFMKSHMWSREN